MNCIWFFPFSWFLFSPQWHTFDSIITEIQLSQRQIEVSCLCRLAAVEGCATVEGGSTTTKTDRSFLSLSPRGCRRLCRRWRLCRPSSLSSSFIIFLRYLVALYLFISLGFWQKVFNFKWVSSKILFCCWSSWRESLKPNSWLQLQDPQEWYQQLLFLYGIINKTHPCTYLAQARSPRSSDIVFWLKVGERERERERCQSEPTRVRRVGSPRAGLKMSEPNPAHFMVSQKFCNPAQPTTGWLVKWVSSPTHLKKLLLFSSIQIFK